MDFPVWNRLFLQKRSATNFWDKRTLINLSIYFIFLSYHIASTFQDKFVRKVGLHTTKLYLHCYWSSTCHQLTVPSNWISIILLWEIPSDKLILTITTLGWISGNGQEKSKNCIDICRKLYSITLSLSEWSNYQLWIMSHTEIICKLYFHKKH